MRDHRSKRRMIRSAMIQSAGRLKTLHLSKSRGASPPVERPCPTPGSGGIWGADRSGPENPVTRRYGRQAGKCHLAREFSGGFEAGAQDSQGNVRSLTGGLSASRRRSLGSEAKGINSTFRTGSRHAPGGLGDGCHPPGLGSAIARRHAEWSRNGCGGMRSSTDYLRWPSCGWAKGIRPSYESHAKARPRRSAPRWPLPGQRGEGRMTDPVTSPKVPPVRRDKQDESASIRMRIPLAWNVGRA